MMRTDDDESRDDESFYDRSLDNESRWDDDEASGEPALVICPQCGAETDDESILCPVCQGPLRPQPALRRSFVLAIILVLILLFLWPFLGWLIGSE